MLDLRQEVVDVFEVQAHDADGVPIDVGSALFDSIDVARGFAVGIARWQIATGEQNGQAHILSDGKRIEGATFEYWAQAELQSERET